MKCVNVSTVVLCVRRRAGRHIRLNARRIGSLKISVNIKYVCMCTAVLRVRLHAGGHIRLSARRIGSLKVRYEMCECV